MDETLPAHRELCLTCRRPRSVCWCGALRPVDSKTRVVFIQHPRETRVPVSTCRMAHLSLPNSELHIALKAQGNPQLEAVARQPGTAVLFPSESAVDVGALTEPPRTLIVVDGTWSNAKKVVEKCPVLSALPRIAFTPEQPGNYRIRKEPAEHCLSTIEAVAQVLERLEAAPGRFTPMLNVFERMVDRQLEFIAATGNQSRHRRFKLRNSPRADAAQVLRDAADRLVLVFGEANAWPLDRADRPLPDEPELLQLVARRLGGGAAFDAVLEPKRPLSPSAPFHLDLVEAAFASAEGREAALARWARFLRDDDVLVGWGPFCVDLLRAEGQGERPFVDLRRVMSQRLQRRPGSVERWAGTLGVPLPDGQGRALRRLTAMRALTQALLDGALPADS